MSDAVAEGAAQSAIPVDVPLRNDLLGEEPYGAPQLNVPVCLNVNENPYPLSPVVADAIADAVRQAAVTLNRYPDREHMRLRRALCDYLVRESGVRLDPVQVWAANGSNEIMLQLFEAFGGPGRTVLGCDPTYSMYPEYARDTFTTWRTVPRTDVFTVDVAATVEAIAQICPAMVVLTSPNNPTGTMLGVDELCAIMAACRECSVRGAGEGVHPLVVVDEAYIEFRDPSTASAVSLLGEWDHLVVSRTMSKAFAFAGARVGYVVAASGVINALRVVRLPYHLSAITQAAAVAALEHADEQLRQVAHLRELREQTAVWLAQQTYRGVPLNVAQSASNFLMFGGAFEDRDALFDEMLSRGVLIRAVGPRGWMRVCMGTDEEMAAFREALVESLRAVESRQA